MEILRNSEMQAADEKETQTKAAQDMVDSGLLEKNRSKLFTGRDDFSSKTQGRSNG